MQIPPKILTIINEIIRNEGGYVNHPNDRGGPTQYGCTAATIGHYFKLGRDATIAEVKALTKDDARQIYYKQYFLRPNLDELPEGLWDTVFDMQVNAGYNAIKILQRLVNVIAVRAKDPKIAVDGGIGHNTITRVLKYYNNDPMLFVDNYGLSRIGYYINIVKRRPSQKVFLKGWVKRGNKYIRPQNKFDIKNLDQYLGG